MNHLISSNLTLFKRVLKSREQDRVDVLAAGVTYFTLFALAPLLLLLVYVSSVVLQRGDEIRRELVLSISNAVGAETAKFVENLIQAQQVSEIRDIAGIVAVVLVLWSVISWVENTRSAVHLMWRQPLPKLSLKDQIIQKVVDLGFMLGVSSLLISSFAAQALLNIVREKWQILIPVEFTNLLIVFTLIAVALMILLQYLSPRSIRWITIRNCSLFGAFLYVLLSTLLSWYLTQFAPQSAFAAAGSVIVLLLWIYYNVQVFFFLMEIVKVSDGR
jgi:membrane protein